MEDASSSQFIVKREGRIKKPEESPRLGKDVRDRSINMSRTMEGKY